MANENEREIRKQAIERFGLGESPSRIYRELGRSKPWFFKWLRRYRSGNPEWFLDQPRAVGRSRNRIPPEVEQAIAEVRSGLMATKYSQVGANAVNWELEKRGRPAVAVATIQRVIRRQGLIRPKERRPSKGKRYPEWGIDWPNRLHQADLVGPRYLKNDGRFYSFNVMDVYTHRVKVNPLRTKEDDPIAGGLVRSWQALGVPEYLQLDNELSFRGSNRYPRSFGVVLKLCFYFHVVPIFIPIQEPWRNGEIERFNGTFDRMFFRAQVFPSFAALGEEAEKFEQYHNQNHVYSCLGGVSPNARLGDSALTMVPTDFKLPPRSRLREEEGEVRLVRFIRSDRVLNVFGEKFQVSPELVYEYVEAVISTAGHVLQVYHDNRWVHSIVYSIPQDLGLTEG